MNMETLATDATQTSPVAVPKQLRAFTSETARKAQAVAAQVRKKNNLLRKLALLGYDPPSQLPTSQTSVVTPTAKPDYVAKRLLRVRKQLSKLDRLIESENDPQKLDRLACAQARLSEQERILDNRPLPGSHRPKSPAKAKTPGALGPIDSEA
jgi:hypothetical protein